MKQLIDALKVITLTPETVKYLEEHDPQALLQARRAIETATGETVAEQAQIVNNAIVSREQAQQEATKLKYDSLWAEYNKSWTKIQ